MGKQTLDETKNRTKIDENAIIEKIEAEMSRYIESSFQNGLEAADADKMEMCYHTLKMRLRQGKVSVGRLERLVSNVLNEFANGLRDGHWPDPVEQVLYLELAILVALVEADVAAENN